jgi:diguanylate cyclase (GGDEF)-like protein
MNEFLIRDEEGDVLRVLRAAFRKALARHREARLTLFLQLQFPMPGDSAAWNTNEILDGLDMRPLVKPELTASVARHHLFEAFLQRQEDALQQARVALSAAAEGQLEQGVFLDLTSSLQRFDVALDRLDNGITVSLTHVDELTGLLNRAAMELDLEREQAHSRRSAKPLCVAMIDADYFKQVNDEYGHGFGDHVLEELAERFERSLRPRDRAYRYGGEEFLVLLPDTELAEAARVAERLRQRARKRPIVDGPLSINQTISVGLTRVLAEEGLDEALDRADRALYDAKNAGRDCVVTLPAPDPQSAETSSSVPDST